MQSGKQVTEYFKEDERLNSLQLYTAAIGLFEKNNDFEFVTSVTRDNVAGFYQIIEGARVYKNKKTNEYHILYYPAKDNKDSTTVDEQKDIPLNALVHEVERKLSGNSWYEKAKKHFMICESNTYLGFQVSHFIYANINNDALITDDSIDRYPLDQYDLSFVTKTFPKKIHKPIHRGWQAAVYENWQCGHYALLALDREISQRPLTREDDKVIIDSKIIQTHNHLYAIGLNANIQRGELKGEENKRELIHKRVNILSPESDSEGFQYMDDLDDKLNGGDDDGAPFNNRDNEDNAPADKHDNKKNASPTLISQPNPGFWERHKAKLIGGGVGTLFGIGLAIGLSIGLAPLTGGGSLVVGGLLIAGLCVSSIWLGASAGVGAGVIVENCCQTPSSTASMHREFGSKPGVGKKSECRESNDESNQKTNHESAHLNRSSESLCSAVKDLDINPDYTSAGATNKYY